MLYENAAAAAAAAARAAVVVVVVVVVVAAAAAAFVLMAMWEVSWKFQASAQYLLQHKSFLVVLQLRWEWRSRNS